VGKNIRGDRTPILFSFLFHCLFVFGRSPDGNIARFSETAYRPLFFGSGKVFFLRLSCEPPAAICSAVADPLFLLSPGCQGLDMSSRACLFFLCMMPAAIRERCGELESDIANGPFPSGEDGRESAALSFPFFLSVVADVEKRVMLTCRCNSTLGTYEY